MAGNVYRPDREGLWAIYAGTQLDESLTHMYDEKEKRATELAFHICALCLSKNTMEK